MESVVENEKRLTIKQRSALRARAWRLANPERNREIVRRCFEKNRKRYAEASRTWAAANAERLRDYSRYWSLAKKYGITRKEYIALLEAQNGLCAICSAVPGDRRSTYLLVDHDHSTGAVRGLLCRRCNTGLGLFSDDPALLTRALTYMKETNAKAS